MLLETNRLLLKSYDLTLAEQVFHVVQQQEIAHTLMHLPHPYPRNFVERWITYVKESYEQGTAYELAIFLKETEQYIGNCGLVSVTKAHKKAEIGYFIDVHHWGKGYATEACQEVLAFGFTTLHLNRISGRCMTRNPASRNVLEKIGMTFEGRHRQEFMKNNLYEDIDYLAILANDYFTKR